jgi:transposase InsO family protein
MKRPSRPARDLARPRLAMRLCAALGDTPNARHRVATAVGVTDRTLRRWAQRRRSGEPLVRPRGRRPSPVARHRRQGLIGALLRLGPCAGVPVLRGLFGDVPYRTIAKLKRRFARAIQRRRGWHRRRLLWLRAGATWATDFTHPEARLPGTSNRLCLVRDLGSGAQLAAAPSTGERASVVCAVLAALFVALGPPLVLKHDGGGAFRADATQALLRDHGVVALRSPPRTPQYNGSCERSGGTLKQRVAYVAWANGRPNSWTQADIEEALRQANTTARPRGANGSTPAEALAARRPIGRGERRAFKRTRALEIARALKTHESKHGTMPTCAERAAIVRKATQHALCKHGYLEFRRGRLSTPISTWRADIKA